MVDFFGVFGEGGSSLSEFWTSEKLCAGNSMKNLVG